MSNGHSPIGASSAHRWFACPGSVELIKKAPPQESSVHAARGTAAHEVLEKCLGTDKSVWDFEETEYEGGELNEEDIEALEETIDWLESKISPTDTLHKEVKVDLERIHKGLYGTADIVIEDKDNKSILRVYDYKHGSGQAVEVEGNEQLMYYALGAIAKLNPACVNLLGWGPAYQTVEIGILQPRKDHPDGAFRTWVVPSETLEEFAEELGLRAKATTKKDAPLAAGKHCYWCPAKPICGAMYNQTLEVTKQDFRVIESKPLPTVNELSLTDISKILEHEDMISSWLKSIKAHALQQLEKGNAVPGFKLVKKKANRVWVDNNLAVHHLRNLGYPDEDLYESKMISPAKAEKLISKEDKKEIQIFITKPDTGNTIAKQDDRRQEVSASIETDFEIIENERSQ